MKIGRLKPLRLRECLCIKYRDTVKRTEWNPSDKTICQEILLIIACERTVKERLASKAYQGCHVVADGHRRHDAKGCRYGEIQRVSPEKP
jgi:hypothetical protein